MRLLSSLVFFTVLSLAATAQAFEVKAYTGAPGKAGLEDLSPTPEAPGNRDNIFYGEQYSFATRVEGADNAWFQFGFSNLGAGSGRAIVQADFTPKGGKPISFKQAFPRGDWTCEKAPLKLAFGKNTLAFDGTLWTVHIEAKDFTADYTLENLTPAWKPGNGEVDFGSEGSYRIQVVAPRAKLSGKVVLKDGTEHQISGFAYGDHSFTNMAPQKQARRWLRIRKIGARNTIMFHALQTPEQFGNRWVSWLVVAGDKGIQASVVNPDLSFGEMETDSPTGYTIPNTIFMKNEAGFQGAVKTSQRVDRDDQLAGLSTAERMIVSKFIKPIAFKYDTKLELLWPGRKPLKASARMFYDQMF
jgi:hypothetical protein